jgi:hypothetical protein
VLLGVLLATGVGDVHGAILSGEIGNERSAATLDLSRAHRACRAENNPFADHANRHR